MDELGIDISRQRSKSADQFRDTDLDLVVTVCDDAAKRCPAWVGQGTRRHIAFEDPARAGGSEEERMAVFRRVRDRIRRQVTDLLVGMNP
jgi:arsenate reductase